MWTAMRLCRMRLCSKHLCGRPCNKVARGFVTLCVFAASAYVDKAWQWLRVVYCNKDLYVTSCLLHTPHRHTHTHTQSFNGLFFQDYLGRPVPEGSTILDFLKQRWRGGSGISIRKSFALRSDRQPCQHLITQVFTGRMPFLPPNQQRQSTEGKSHLTHLTDTVSKFLSWVDIMKGTVGWGHASPI